jgi:ATP-dependent DNA helicase RecQ
MSSQSSWSEGNTDAMLLSVLQRALLLDLEVSPVGKILKVGAALGSRHLARSGNISFEAICDELTGLSVRAGCLLGHNLISHDLPYLRGRSPNLPFLRLPVIDTLVLSPICFPENPYHRLVKDYKLVRESINDPVADARQAASLFADEFQALNSLRHKEPRLFEVLHFLLATADVEADPLSNGMALVFRCLGADCLAKERVLGLCRELIPQWG